MMPALEPRLAYRLWAPFYPPHAHNPFMLAEERAMLEMLPADLRGMTVLDAGCGSGRYMLHAHRRGARAVFGMDLTFEMLQRAKLETTSQNRDPRGTDRTLSVAQAGLDAIPVRDNWADLVICGLALGHLPFLTPPLSELRRVMRPNGLLLCSDLHPIGETLGWKRDFKAAGRHYEVQHTTHSLATWRTVCAGVGLRIECIVEACISSADVPAGAQFDHAALEQPVALALALRNRAKVNTVPPFPIVGYATVGGPL